MLEMAHRYFSSRLYNITKSQYFRAQLLQIPVSETKSNFLLPRRFLKLDADAATGGGDVIRTVSRTQYLVSNRGVAEFQDVAIFKTLRLYEVTDVVPVTTTRVEADDILGRSVATDDPDKKKTIYCAIEPTILEPDGLRSVTKQARIISNAALAIDDVVAGKYKIIDVNDEGGLYYYVANKL